MSAGNYCVEKKGWLATSISILLKEYNMKDDIQDRSENALIDRLAKRRNNLQNRLNNIFFHWNHALIISIASGIVLWIISFLDPTTPDSWKWIGFPLGFASSFALYFLIIERIRQMIRSQLRDLDRDLASTGVEALQQGLEEDFF